MALSTLDAATVPDVIITLLSTDKQLASDAENRLQELLTNAKSPQDSAYFSNALFIIHGKVAEVEALQAKMTDEVNNFQSINEEGALVIGTLATALTQLGNIALMTALAGTVAAAIKAVFSLTKLLYKNARRKDLEMGTHEVLTRATTECVKIYNEAYKPREEIKVPPGLAETLSKKALFLAKSII
jgi:hypothetical protein